MTTENENKNKLCYRCYDYYPLSKFQKRNNKILGVCRYCYNKHYAHLVVPKEKKKRKRRVSKRNIVYNHLRKNPCVDCGETDIVVLQFDHKDPRKKKYSISSLIAEGSYKKLGREIAKCDVVCANCHTRRTANMFGS